MDGSKHSYLSDHDSTESVSNWYVDTFQIELNDFVKLVILDDFN